MRAEPRRAEPHVLRVSVVTLSDGLLRSFKASGHAGMAKPGQNIACAAATALLRTAARLLASADGLVDDGAAGEPGSMELVVTSQPQVRDRWLAGVTDFLLRGLDDLAREYPREIRVDVERMSG